MTNSPDEPTHFRYRVYNANDRSDYVEGLGHSTSEAFVGFGEGLHGLVGELGGLWVTENLGLSRLPASRYGYRL